MKILLVHPADDPEKGPWAARPWDRIVDAGLGGVQTYERWRRHFNCPVTPLSSLQKGIEDLRQVRALFDAGCDRLLDGHGLDWWEIMSMLLTEEAQLLLLLQRFANTLGSDDRVFVSRPGLHASLLEPMLAGRVTVFPWPRGNRSRGFRHYLGLSRKLSASQLIDIFWDKYDAGYQFRGRLPRKRSPPQTHPVVLLPTAYVNVSRTGIAYANSFPEENFLLVSTRRSGSLPKLPGNVSSSWLSSYASLCDRRAEIADIENRWQFLRTELKAAPEFDILDRLGHLDMLSHYLRHGLEVRDAWRNVLDREPAEAMLCADDSNPFTRIPVLLAAQRGLPNVTCHHGALDGRHVYKRLHGDRIWAKGAMEEDYLVRVCGVAHEKVEIAAPGLPENWSAAGRVNSETFRPYILFLSEASDVFGGRPEEFYRDVLPPLAGLARATGRKLIVKLHPAESESERSAMVGRILTAEDKSATRVVTGPLTEALLTDTWFGITVLSTAAFECAVRGIPCFLCKWLEFSPHGYVEQFIRFGVAAGLNHPDEINKIPEHLERSKAASAPNISGERPGANIQNPNFFRATSHRRATDLLWRPAAQQRLREIITAPQKACPLAS